MKIKGEPWLMFIIGLLLLVVIACIVTIAIAIKHPDQSAAGSYIKKGLAIEGHAESHIVNNRESNPDHSASRKKHLGDKQ